MSDLEVAAQPYLGMMMSGYAVAFPRPARSTVAAWAAKTAMMLLYSLSPPLSPHPSLLAHMYEHHTVPRPVRVWLASYKSAVPIPGQFVVHLPAYARLDHTAAGSVINPGSAPVASLTLDQLALQVWLPTDPTSRPSWPPLGFMEGTVSRVIAVWPGPVHDLEWPPPESFNDIGFWRFAGKNDNDIRKAIEMLYQDIP